MTKIHASKSTFIASGDPATTVLAGKGYLHAILISTATSGAVQTATFYDSLAGSGEVLLVLNLYYLYSNPNHIVFPANMPLEFTTGLTIDPGNCDVHVTVRAG